VHLNPFRLLLVLATGCAPAISAQAPQPVPVAPRPSRTDILLDSLPLRARIAQLVMPWIPGTPAATDASLALAWRWIDSLQVGGIIVSVGTPLEVAAKLNGLQRRSQLPLLISTDLEGGTAIRFSGGTPFPTNMGVAAGGSESDAYAMGRVTATEGRAVGIHLTFSPVADVNNNPANPIINTRAFGADPAMVGRFVAATVRGIQDAGLLATAKHFPGHGDTGTDSHLAMPVVLADWARLDSLELVPFRAAIRAGVAAVMSAHIALPTVDGGPSRPATLAPSILTGVLRDSLGFRGLVVTDALDMGALIQLYGPGESAVLAFLAGSDLLLQPTDPFAVVNAMEAAVRSGRISPERLDQSVRRVLEIKERLGLFESRVRDLNQVAEVVGRAEHQGAALDASRRAIVLARDDLGSVDSLRTGPQPIVLVGYGEGPGAQVGDSLVWHLRRKGYPVSVARIRPGPTMAADIAAARRAVTAGGMPVFAVSVRATSGRGTLALPDSVAALIEATAGRQPTVLVSFGSPYVLTQAPATPSFVVAWTANSLTELAVAEALSGGAITGRLPIPIPPLLAAGAGLQRAAR